MKKAFLAGLLLVLVTTILLPITARGRSHDIFFINTFTRENRYNGTGGKNETIFTGVVRKTPPWCMTTLVRGNERKRALRLEYDVTQGSVAYVVYIASKEVLRLFNTLTFFARGDADTVTIQLVGREIHEYSVTGIAGPWQSFEIPFRDFSNYDRFHPHSISAIWFIIKNRQVTRKSGEILLDDIGLRISKSPKSRVLQLPAPTRIQKIQGATPSTKPYPAEHLELEATYRGVRRVARFKGVRFEASWDRVHWFYIGEDTTRDDTRFTVLWDARFFETGTYWLRAVAMYANGRRSPGRVTSMNITNSFNFAHFLTQIQRKSFRYFVKERDTVTGLIHASTETRALVSTTACGFGLSVYCIGAERGFIDRTEAAANTLQIIETYLAEVPCYYGFYPEQPAAVSGDIMATAYLTAGALTAYYYFDSYKDPIEKRIRTKALSLVKRVHWKRALTKEGTRTLLAKHINKDGTTEGSLVGYGPHLLAYVLALAAPSHAIKPAQWHDWTGSYVRGTYGSYSLLQFPSLYGHQVSHIWLNVDGMSDNYANYFENSVTATLINREYCLRENAYDSELWGLSACIGAGGYYEYGAPPPPRTDYTDGTVCPACGGSSLIFTPVLANAALYGMYKTYGDTIWGTYGFYESFNPKERSITKIYTAMNLGNLILQIENYQSGLIWELFGRNPRIKRTLKKVGFKKAS